MKSVTKFLRRKGYAVGQIKRLFQDLHPTAGHCEVEVDRCGTLDEVERLLTLAPELRGLAETRDSLEDVGVMPVTEFGYTLKLPLTAGHSSSTAYFYFTRVAPDRWVCHRHSPR